MISFTILVVSVGSLGIILFACVAFAIGAPLEFLFALICIFFLLRFLWQREKRLEIQRLQTEQHYTESKHHTLRQQVDSLHSYDFGNEDLPDD